VRGDGVIFVGQKVTPLSKATNITLFMRHGAAWASPGNPAAGCTPV
jgi:hypothetical protein